MYRYMNGRFVDTRQIRCYAYESGAKPGARHRPETSGEHRRSSDSQSLAVAKLHDLPGSRQTIPPNEKGRPAP